VDYNIMILMWIWMWLFEQLWIIYCCTSVVLKVQCCYFIGFLIPSDQIQVYKVPRQPIHPS
jgi:hypothetical protein